MTNLFNTVARISDRVYEKIMDMIRNFFGKGPGQGMIPNIGKRLDEKLFRIRREILNAGSYVLMGNEGVGVIELVLILVVLIALVLIFKERISTLLENIFDQIESSASKVY